MREGEINFCFSPQSSVERYFLWFYQLSIWVKALLFFYYARAACYQGTVKGDLSYPYHLSLKRTGKLTPISMHVTKDVS